MKFHLLLLLIPSTAFGTISKLQKLIGMNYATINRVTNALIQKKSIMENDGIMFCYNLKHFETKELPPKLVMRQIIKPVNNIIALSGTKELTELSQACNEIAPLLKPTIQKK